MALKDSEKIKSPIGKNGRVAVACSEFGLRSQMVPAVGLWWSFTENVDPWEVLMALTNAQGAGIKQVSDKKL